MTAEGVGVLALVDREKSPKWKRISGVSQEGVGPGRCSRWGPSWQARGPGDWSLGFSERTDLLVSMPRGLQPQTWGKSSAALGAADALGRTRTLGHSSASSWVWARRTGLQGSPRSCGPHPHWDQSKGCGDGWKVTTTIYMDAPASSGHFRGPAPPSARIIS